MIKNIRPGNDVPNDINVVIEISANNEPVKYEFNKDSNILTVDRFMSTTMQYPCNYGFIPNTLSEDSDPVDVLVVSPVDLRPGVMINCRPVGVLKMEDESGIDSKIIAVPTDKLTRAYTHIKDVVDLPKLLLLQIQHFFEHYKDLEPKKWAKVKGFEKIEMAKKDIKDSIERFKLH